MTHCSAPCGGGGLCGAEDQIQDLMCCAIFPNFQNYIFTYFGLGPYSSSAQDLLLALCLRDYSLEVGSYSVLGIKMGPIGCKENALPVPYSGPFPFFFF